MTRGRGTLREGLEGAATGAAYGGILGAAASAMDVPQEETASGMGRGSGQQRGGPGRGGGGRRPLFEQGGTEGGRHAIARQKNLYSYFTPFTLCIAVYRHTLEETSAPFTRACAPPLPSSTPEAKRGPRFASEIIPLPPPPPLQALPFTTAPGQGGGSGGFQAEPQQPCRRWI